jgi:sucrose phosphorylase
VKLLRDIMETVRPDSILLTETNVPNPENLSYFGDGDEAHMVYQFSLPPLLLHALYSGSPAYFNRWVSEIPELPKDCTFFNFTASHDGIGVRPLEGLLPVEELNRLLEGMTASGGKISTRRNSDGTDSPYEINITYFDAMKQTTTGEDHMQKQRFLASQTVMMEMKGMPAFYIHSLLGTHNYTAGVAHTGRARTINRRKWNEPEIENLLQKENDHSKILNELKRIINIRKKQAAFHPDGAQTLVNLGDQTIAIKRVSPDQSQEIVCVTNISKSRIELPAANIPDFDLLQNMQVDINENKIMVKPYQTLWLT